jgi:AP-3 complex subunit beta
MNFFSMLGSKTAAKEQEKPKQTKGLPKSDGDMYTLSLSNQPIITLLKSESEADKLKGMKILIAMQITRKEITPFVPHVVNLITGNFQVKKLTYFFLTYCSGKAKDHILMSINTFHKDLTDSKALLRASALRAFSSLKIEEIVNVLTLALQRGASDFSIYVRRSTCFALIKISEWEDCDRSLIMLLLSKLLSDSNIMVIGPALMAFNRICPAKLFMLHGHFRRLVRSLPLLEFIFVSNALLVLLRYARIYLDVQYLDRRARINYDFKVLLETAEKMLCYDSPSLILAISRFFLFFQQENYYGRCVIALLSFKYQPFQIAYLQLCMLFEFALKAPLHFSHLHTYFYVTAADNWEIAGKKLEILSAIACEANANPILKELATYTSHENSEIATWAIRTIGKVCENHPALYIPCTKQLISLLKSKSPYIAAQVIIVMRTLIIQEPQKHRKLIVHCAKNIENIQVPAARACALWIIGKYHHIMPTLAIETLRKLSLSFPKEFGTVKHQILNSVAKIYAETQNERLFSILKYLLEAGFYDLSYDIRDKCRLLSSIFVSKEVRLSDFQLFEGGAEVTVEKNEASAYVPLSLSYLTGSRVKGYETYFEDLENREGLEKTLGEDTTAFREEEVAPVITVKQSTSYSNADVKQVAGSGLQSRVVVNDPEKLKAFLEEEDEEEEEEEEEEESEEDG